VTHEYPPNRTFDSVSVSRVSDGEPPRNRTENPQIKEPHQALEMASIPMNF
jgi:hypothetical protein